MKKVEEALELLVRKIDKINKTDQKPDNTLDEIRDILYRREK